MARRVAFSGKDPSLMQVAKHFVDVEASIRHFFSPSTASHHPRFFGYTIREIEQERNERGEELDISSCFAALSCVEAAFRIDYLQRCYARKRDPLSRHFRQLYKNVEARVSFEEDLLEAWKQHCAVPATLIGDLRAAFRFRHWLAHGRYWVPKFGRRYDYASISLLASQVFATFPFVRPE